MTKKIHVVAATLVFFCVACGKKPAAAPKAAPPTSASPETSAAPAAPANPDPSVTKFRFGTGFAPDGTVATETSVLAAGELACASFDVLNPGADPKVRVAWIHQPDKKTVARDEAAMPREKPFVSFKADTKTWPLGDYVLEISIANGDQIASLGTTNFKIQKDRPR